ncbi:dihydroxyacetone kinase phosphoryl donor subunit DhaM [uncultured Tessaracoccus sp.]|uniref:dihydroxyacetone kinase phosphoryl donor subunit DhaM n=1 Tax=uncultured Tessaracoccus sp. TaxID=905023 RepID=UPI002622C9D3|nr:dihydroxyacetone kinase phosphoryl donor subunit DhaM [uncultured Tessaracoccus sp.]
MSVGIVVVSHSAPLAQAALDLAAIMVHGEMPPVATAAGMPGGSFGTDAATVMTAIEDVTSADGVAVFVDMGSAIMSAETAIDLLGSPYPVRIAAAPIVEGLTAGLITAATGGSLDAVIDAAESALDAKWAALGRVPVDVLQPATESSKGNSAQALLTSPIGLHARPASKLAALAMGFDAEILIARGDGQPVNAKSTVSLMALGAVCGDMLHVYTQGPQAAAAQDAVVQFIASGLGE